MYAVPTSSVQLGRAFQKSLAYKSLLGDRDVHVDASGRGYTHSEPSETNSDRARSRWARQVRFHLMRRDVASEGMCASCFAWSQTRRAVGQQVKERSTGLTQP